MSDPRSSLQRKWETTNRFGNFGDAIVSVKIDSIRCHAKTLVEINSPITAFSGLNGTGKSTILQLAACAYNRPYTSQYYVSDFITANPLDPTCIVSAHSSVKFEFWSTTGKPSPLTLSYRGYWDGYNRRRNRKREILFAGIGKYLPQAESKSKIRKFSKLKIRNSQPANQRIFTWVKKILAQDFDSIVSNETSVNTRHGNKLASVTRDAIGYSEPNMGFGEARAIHLVQLLETIPAKSLVLIEEPETSLHQSAQAQFAFYLMDVCSLRGHQIMLTTHSEFMLSVLPSSSLVYLDRQGSKVSPVLGVSAMQCKSLMAGGHVKALNILVEDEVAKAVLHSIILRHDPKFLSTCGIHVGGDKDRIASGVRCFKDTGLSVAAVRDGDVGPSPIENIFKLPGILPPEKEIFQSTALESHLATRYSVKLGDFRPSLPTADHHEWFPLLSRKLGMDETALIWEAARSYVESLPDTETAILVKQLKEAAQPRKIKT